jgi:hypothetical protein
MINLMSDPDKEVVLRVLELGANHHLLEGQHNEAITILNQLAHGASIRDFVNALDASGTMSLFSAGIKKSFLMECTSNEGLTVSAIHKYKITGVGDADAYLIWPIDTAEGQIALINVDLAYRSDFCDKTSKVTDKAIEIVKKHFVPIVHTALVMESVAGVRNNFALVNVANQDESHQEFALTWNFVSQEPMFEHLGLPMELFDLPYVESDLPKPLPLSRLQRDHEDAVQKQIDTDDLLDCLYTLKDLLTRSPGKVRIQVSEETAIALLAAHGEEAVEALEDVQRFPDESA